MKSSAFQLRFMHLQQWIRCMQDAMATRKLDHVIMYVTIWKARDIVRIGEVFEARSTQCKRARGVAS
jgi:hypothetical protein